MARTIGTVAILLALAGCGGGTAEDSNTAEGSGIRKIEVANPYHDRLMALSPVNQRLALRRAIQDTGESCKKIVQAAYVAPYKGQQMWSGRCQPGGDWAVFVGANGDVQVRSCADVRTLGLPECKLPAEAAS